MSTRGCIARRTNTKAGPGFKGRYHHWDGYPSGLGKTLFKLYNGHFKKDLKAMLKYLIDDHPAGWSTINGADFTKPPGSDSGGPSCYCHGDRSEEAFSVTHKNASDSGVEYAYVFEKTTMFVLSSCYKEGDGKMISMFGCGAEASKSYWKVIGTVDLNGKEPKWEKMR